MSIFEEFKDQVGQTKLSGCANFLTNLNGFGSFVFGITLFFLKLIAKEIDNIK